MYFEADLNNAHYKIDVVETQNHWKISIKKADEPWVDYKISKRDYQRSESYYSFLFKGVSYLIDVVGKDTQYTVFTRNSFREVKIYNEEMLLHESLKRGGQFGKERDLKANMPGKIIEIFAKPGEVIAAGKPLLIMEAMKMENEIRTPVEVKIREVMVKQGQAVETGQILMQFED